MIHSIRRHTGFTLVEILVTIGVICLLSALVFPVISHVREGARTRACNSNLHQLGMAFQEYRADWAERFPRAATFSYWGSGSHWVAGTNGAAIGTLSGAPGLIPDGCDPDTCNKANPEGGAIYSYVKSPDLYVCPSNREGKIKRLSYSMNCALAQMADNRIKEPASIVLLVDEDTCNDGYFFAADTSDPSVTFEFTGATSTDLLTQKHNGGGNLLFVDGHAAFYPYAAFPLDATPIGLQDKGRTSGTPRFHDLAFGPHGSYMPPPPPPPDRQVDACGILP